MILSIQFVQEIALALNLFCPFEVKKKKNKTKYLLSLLVFCRARVLLYIREMAGCGGRGRQSRERVPGTGRQPRIQTGKYIPEDNFFQSTVFHHIYFHTCMIA